MPDVLSTSVSGLLAFQRALDVTSNNISNAATPGYSVESANMMEQPEQATSAGYIGSGVQVQSVTRAYDELLAGQVRTSQANYSGFNTFATQAAQVDNMLSDSTTGISASLQNFVNALQTVANSPASTAQRQVMLSQAQSLTQQLQNYSSQITTYSGGVESNITNTVNSINTLSSNIANLNGQISQALNSTGQTPNGLLDQRDSLIDQLSQYVTVNTANQGDGSMNVYIGNGQPLVTGSVAQTLSAFPDPSNSSEHDIGLVAGNSTADITSEITGGSLGGLLNVRSQVLTPAQNTLGQFAVGLASVVNQAQASGMDLSGATGKPMFSIGGVITAPATTNTGTAAAAVTRSNVSALTADDYKLTYTGGAWQLTDTTSGQPVTLTGAGTAASPFQAAGLSIVVSGAPVTGDSIAIRPTAGAIGGMAVLLTSGSQIAAASSIVTTPAAANTGKAVVAGTAITSPSTYTAGTYTLSFTSATQYQVTDAAGNPVTSGTYSAGTPISFNGQQVTLNGSPAAGDSFTVGAASSTNTGDNSNAFAMIDALTASTFNNGTTSLTGVATNLVSRVGVLTQQAQANASAQKSVNQSATDARSNLSGVNLDEEAAKMVQYQQAYQACAQMIQTSNTMFNSLISAIHG